MYCKNLKKRQKKINKYKIRYYYYCIFLKKEISLSQCKECDKKEYKERKSIPIKKQTSKHRKAEKNRFSIIVDDMSVCAECCKKFKRSDLNYHEIFFGKNRQKSIKYGLVIPLYWKEYHNQIEQKGIHFNKELCLKWQIIAQLKWQEYYNKTEDDFIKEFRHKKKD